MDAAIDLFCERWSGTGDQGPRLWLGGVSATALGRSARNGLSLLLPQTLPNAKVERLLGELSEIASAAGKQIDRVATIRHACITDGSAAEAEAAKERMVAPSREYQGAWWQLKGKPAFEVPELLEGQMNRATETALIGTADEIREQVEALAAIGVDLVVMHVYPGPTDFYRDQMERIAAATASLNREGVR
jgi:alkanesulfonate monooxygenase SsuD/methylene tetrahydromethanopterin reductase-like flavin-dependent oxidoreductase (luciferase family)